VIVVRLATDRPAGLSFEAALTRPADAAVEPAGARRLRMYGRVT